MKTHDESVTWDKKETPHNKDHRDRLWMLWCELMTMKVHKDYEKGEVRWWCWRRIKVNKSISNNSNLTKESILLRQNILKPLLRPNHLSSVVIKPLRVMKLTVNWNPTKKKGNKIINGVNNYINVHHSKNAKNIDFINTRRPKNAKEVGQQPY